MATGTAKVSSKGQFVIPQDVREEAGIQAGDTLLVRVRGGDVVLSKMTKEREDAMEDFFAWAQRQAKIKGLRKRDVQSWVDEIRGKR